MKPSDSNVIVKIEALKYPIDLNNTDGPIQESSQIEECPLCLEECTECHVLMNNLPHTLLSQGYQKGTLQVLFKS
ncbi:hypothetical protein PGTUg99_001831 [Puccinia graminis f. sp. tritici]|uniref:Uncharacterized protein n=1 Tax=Puccinia graminis f. sp. tritici TaxID=56615 RepID=A0A5B0RQC9_PUCGR|nr:hypothetical protein PGTUg99_001831 [Puccinia graminis f. sp. tritici]